MQRLTGKSILLAGAGAIGSEIARRYASEGAGVVIGDIDLAAARAVAQEIADGGGRAAAVRLDGADDVSIQGALNLASQTFGGLDGLHINFAVFEDYASGGSILDLGMARFDEQMRVNVRGFLLCTRHALPLLIARGGGAILYTNSMAAYRGDPERVGYAMSKAATLALMRHVASRHGKDGVRANAIAPGVILRPDQPEAFGPDLVKWATSGAAIKSRIGHPTDIAALSALLMSDEGAFITGQTISVDGGFTMRP